MKKYARIEKCCTVSIPIHSWMFVQKKFPRLMEAIPDEMAYDQHDQIQNTELNK